MKKYIKILACIGIIGLIGVGISIRNSANKDSIETIVNDVSYLMNLRYKGLTDGDKSKIEEIIPTQSQAIISKLDVDDEPIFISLERYFQEIENTTITEETENGLIEYNPYLTFDSERYITELNGERGIYSNNIYIDSDGTFATVIYGQSLYIDAPDEVIIQSYIDNPIYKLKVDSYNYYDNGMLYINYSSDIVGGVEEQYEKGNISLNMEIDTSDNKDDKLKQQEIDTLINDYTNKKTIQNYSVEVKIKDGKIQSIDNSDITGNLIK